MEPQTAVIALMAAMAAIAYTEAEAGLCEGFLVVVRDFAGA